MRPRPFHALNILSGTDHPRLLTLAFETARSFPESAMQRVFSVRTGRFYEVHSLLAATTYHYALGFYGSEEIARRLQSGLPQAWPCAEQPDANAIRRFRNRNHLVVLQALERCLVRFCEDICPDAVGSVPHFVRVLKAEARMRIHQAELADLESEF